MPCIDVDTVPGRWPERRLDWLGSPNGVRKLRGHRAPTPQPLRRVDGVGVLRKALEAAEPAPSARDTVGMRDGRCGCAVRTALGARRSVEQAADRRRVDICLDGWAVLAWSDHLQDGLQQRRHAALSEAVVVALSAGPLERLLPLLPLEGWGRRWAFTCQQAGKDRATACVREEGRRRRRRRRCEERSLRSPAWLTPASVGSTTASRPPPRHPIASPAQAASLRLRHPPRRWMRSLLLRLHLLRRRRGPAPV